MDPDPRKLIDQHQVDGMVNANLARRAVALALEAPPSPALAKLRDTDMHARDLTVAEMWWMLTELKRELT